MLDLLTDLPSVETVSVVVTAIATIALGFFTWVLARETRRLSRATSQAHVIATLEPNQWALNHVDIFVSNTGNAAAHDVTVCFDPPPLDAKGESMRLPFRKVSVIKPGQSLSAYVGEFSLVHKKTFHVTVSWKHQPSERRRVELTYELSMLDYEGFGHLGARSPLVQIAEQVKKLREDWQHVASGSRRLKAETFGAEDRKAEHAQMVAHWEERKKDRGEKGKEDPDQN